jgi:hypothetical protein
MVFHPVLMLEQDKISININDVLAVQRNAVSGLVFLSDSLRKQPVQHAEIDVKRPELPTVKLQVSRSQAVLETVELDEPAFTKRNAEMFPTQVPETRHLERII